MASTTPDPSHRLSLLHAHLVTVDSLQKPVGQTYLFSLQGQLLFPVTLHILKSTQS